MFTVYQETRFASVHSIESGILSKEYDLQKMFTTSTCSLYLVVTISRVDCSNIVTTLSFSFLYDMLKSVNILPLKQFARVR